MQVKAGSVAVGETNQPFKSQPITAAAFKDASASAGNYVQLTGVTFVADKFDNSGIAQVKADDGTIVSLLVSKGVAGRETPTRRPPLPRSGGRSWRRGSCPQIAKP